MANIDIFCLWNTIVIPHGAHSTILLSRPAQGSRALRPAGLQPPLWCTSVSRASAVRSPCLDSYRVVPTITRTELSSVSALYPRGAPICCVLYNLTIL